MNRDFKRGLSGIMTAALLICGCARRVEVGRERGGVEKGMLGSVEAEVPLDYAQILKSRIVNREDLAAILVDKLGSLCASRMKPRFYDSRKGITDIESSDRASYVERAVKLGLMDVFPDGSFLPKDVVQRAHVAIVAQNILRAFRQTSLPKQKHPAFLDVPRTHYAHNAILLAVQRGILSPRSSQLFAPFDPISGQEAVRAADRLKALLR